MAVEIRAATYAALRTALAAGTYQAGQMVFVEGGSTAGDGGEGDGQVYFDAGAGFVDSPPVVVASADGRWAWKRIQFGARMTSGDSDTSAINIAWGSPQNTIDSGDANTINGGGNSASPNLITGDSQYRSINGGYDNLIEAAIASTISGGAHHRILDAATHATVGGGSYNDIETGDYGTIGGGTGNTVSASEAVISGGTTNTLTGRYGVIGGGSTNSVASQGATIAGGTLNSVDGSSTNSVVGGGSDNDIATGSGAIIAGGTQCKIGTATYNCNFASLGGGYQNTIGQSAQSQYAAIAGGRSNTIDADYGAIPGGRGNAVTAQFGFATGYSAIARLPFQRAHGGEAFSVAGDFQESVYMLKRQTTNATPTELRIGAATARLTIPSGATMTFDGLVTAREVSGTQSAGYRISGVIKNDAGTTALVGSATVTALGENNASWDLTVAADNTNDALSITVTGEAATTINWGCALRAVEIVA